MTTRTEALNDALDRLTGYDYLDGGGFACHGPMGAEALSTLGYDDRVGAWVEAYKATHPPIEAPPGSGRLDPNDEPSWRPALGDFSRVSDWAVLFAEELRGQPWQDVLRRWAPRLLAGYAGGLTHGLIRTAHALRAVPAQGPPSDLVLDELAKGLALWAGVFQTLPGLPELRGSLTVQEAVAGLPRPAEPWTPIEAGTFARLKELDEFPEAVEALAPPKAAEAALSDLTAAFCRVILANPEVVPIGLVHAVTPTTAARTLLPYLPEVQIDGVYAHLWQTSAAIVVGFTPPPPLGEQPWLDARDTPTAADVSARAAEHQDPHVIKFAEACARENALRPNPVYMLAAQHVLEHMPSL